jgi:uncharacterized protein (TIGR03086 family)
VEHGKRALRPLPRPVPTGTLPFVTGDTPVAGTTTPVSRLAIALEATGEVIAAVKASQWSDPTPCADWNVRTLVNHLVSGHRMFADILRSEEPPNLASLRHARDLDHLGADPLGSYRDAGAALRAAFEQPKVLERTFESPIGSLPGTAILNLRVTETVVHGWDLARAIGQPFNPPEQLAEAELAFAKGLLTADVPRSGRFGPTQPAADDAPAVDRLAAFLGRPIDTSSTPADRA